MWSDFARCCTCRRCCLRLTLRKVRAKLPRRGLLKIYPIIFMNMFSVGFSIIMLFPYLPFMTVFLIPRLQEDEKDVGKYIGFIGGSMFLGMALGSYFWGMLSDWKGRKLVLIMSAICMGLSTVMFGFSVNFPMAVVSRFLLGLANGVIGTCKAIVSEVSDDNNQAIGVAVLSSGHFTGYIVGPAVAGVIADPVGQYNLTITNPFLHSFLTKFPFSLPPFASILLFALTIVLTIIFLPETLGSKKSRKRSEVNQSELAAFGVDQSQDSALCEEEEGTDETRLLGGEESDDSESRSSNLFISNPAATDTDSLSEDFSIEEEKSINVMEKTVAVERRRELEEEKVTSPDEEEEQDREGMGEQEHEEMEALHRNRYLSAILSTLKNLVLDLRLFFCDSTSLNSLLIYCVFSFGAMSHNELFSLWAFTQPHLGGLGFSLHEIGICLTITGVLILPINLFAFPLLEKRLHVIKTYYLVVILVIPLTLMLPHTHYMVSNKTALWSVLIIISFLTNGFFTTGFSCTTMFINNSVTLDKLGSINGVALVMTSSLRAFAPVIAGSLFSASLSDATLAFGFPVNYNLVFVVLSIVFMITVFMVACLPVSINKQKIIEYL